jgi:hypothetical protein
LTAKVCRKTQTPTGTTTDFSLASILGNGESRCLFFYHGTNDVLLILTNSLDGTADEVVRRIGSESVFRFNLDLWRSYDIRVDSDGFELADPTGRSCRASDLKAAYLRKPSFDDAIDVPAGGCIEAWTRSQLRYATREIYNWCRDAGIVRLVEQDAERRLGKFAQLRLASAFLEVPEWEFVKTSEIASRPWPCITKALTAEFVSDYKVFFTRQVEPSSLDPTYPWMLQRLIAGARDVTIVFVNGRCFAFSLDRNLFEGQDWRKHTMLEDLQWNRVDMPEHVSAGIVSFMRSAGLQFGRLDMIEDDGRYYFLEVNPNGQWGWLDVDGSQGIYDAVIKELTAGWR